MEFDHSTDTITPDDQPLITFGGITGVVLPSGTTGQRPGLTNGTIRYNTSLDVLEAVIAGTFTTLQAEIVAGDGLTKTGSTLNIGTASSARIVVNADNIDLAVVADGGGGSLLKFSRDTYGRITGTSAVTTGDITGLVDGSYVNITGDTMTGALVLPLGTELLPSLTFTSDLNTGMWSPTADTVAISTTGAERFRITSQGAFGIGGTNYGSSGQVLTSAGSTSPPTWQTPTAAPPVWARIFSMMGA